MKPSEQIENILKEMASNDWVNKNSVSNNYDTPESYGFYLRQRPDIILEVIKKYLDEKFK